MRKLGAFFNAQEKPRILDVGTGNGNFIKIIQSLTDNYDEIIGIDNLEIAVSTSRKNFTDERIKFEQMDAFNMEFTDDYFDVVCLSNSLHHLDDIEGIFIEMRRVLKPNGYIIVNEMMSDGLNARQKAHKEIHHFAAEIDRLFGESHNETFKATEILTILRDKSGLDIKDAWNLAFERNEGNTKEEIDWLIDTIERLLKKVENHEKETYFKKKGTKIKKYINRVGFDSATQLVVVLQ